jgi:hypothetical protein
LFNKGHGYVSTFAFSRLNGWRQGRTLMCLSGLL